MPTFQRLERIKRPNSCILPSPARCNKGVQLLLVSLLDPVLASPRASFPLARTLFQARVLFTCKDPISLKWPLLASALVPASVPNPVCDVLPGALRALPFVSWPPRISMALPTRRDRGTPLTAVPLLASLCQLLLERAAAQNHPSHSVKPLCAKKSLHGLLFRPGRPRGPSPSAHTDFTCSGAAHSCPPPSALPPAPPQPPPLAGPGQVLRAFVRPKRELLQMSPVAAVTPGQTSGLV